MTNYPNIQSTTGAIPVIGTVTIANPGTVGSNVTVTNFPGTQAVSGTVTVANAGTVGSTVTVSNFPTLQGVTGTVTVANPGTLGSTVTIANFPSLQAVNTPIPNTFYTGQVKITTTGTAVQLGTITGLQNGVLVQANLNNAAPLFIGVSSSVTTTNNGSGNGYALLPGAVINLSTSVMSGIYFNGTSGDFLYYVAN